MKISKDYSNARWIVCFPDVHSKMVTDFPCGFRSNVSPKIWTYIDLLSGLLWVTPELLKNASFYLIIPEVMQSMMPNVSQFKP